MSKKTAAAIGRRDFFRKAGLGAGAVGVAAAGLSATKVKAAGAARASSKGAGYQETEHVKTFYRLARF